MGCIKAYSVLSFTLLFFNLTAQKSMFGTSDYLLSPNNGAPFRFIPNNDVAGSPLLYDEWKKGTVILANHEKYDSVLLNFDAYGNNILYNQHDTLYELISDVSEIRWRDSEDTSYYLVFKKYVTTDSELNGYVQELCSGKVTIVKKYKKSPEGENKTNGIFETERKYVLHTSVLVIKDNVTVPLKYSSQSLDDLTSDKKGNVDNYIKSNKLNVKKEKGFISAVTYYNTLGLK
jgi:hypothetical protein